MDSNTTSAAPFVVRVSLASEGTVRVLVSRRSLTGGYTPTHEDTIPDSEVDEFLASVGIARDRSTRGDLGVGNYRYDAHPRVEHRAVPAAQTDPYRYLGECACGEVIPGHTRGDVTTGFRAHFAIWRDAKGHATPATA